MKQALLYTHFAAVIIGYVVACAFFSPRVVELMGLGQTIILRSATADSIGATILLLHTIVTAFGVVGFLTGMALMATKEAQKESVTLAVSTIAAFVLLLFAVNMIILRV